MSTQTVRLIDASGNLLAVVQMAEEGEHYGGTIEAQTLPADVRALFIEFEEIVNGQMLSFLDDVQARIAGLRIRAVFADGSEAGVRDLQAYPSTGNVSFKLAETPTYNGKPVSDSGKVRL